MKGGAYFPRIMAKPWKKGKPSTKHYFVFRFCGRDVASLPNWQLRSDSQDCRPQLFIQVNSGRSRERGRPSRVYIWLINLHKSKKRSPPQTGVFLSKWQRRGLFLHGLRFLRFICTANRLPRGMQPTRILANHRYASAHYCVRL
jgi:hypothetical protein